MLAQHSRKLQGRHEINGHTRKKQIKIGKQGGNTHKPPAPIQVGVLIPIRTAVPASTNSSGATKCPSGTPLHPQQNHHQQRHKDIELARMLTDHSAPIGLIGSSPR